MYLRVRAEQPLLAVTRRRDETKARHYVRLRRDGGHDKASPMYQVQQEPLIRLSKRNSTLYLTLPYK